MSEEECNLKSYLRINFSENIVKNLQQLKVGKRIKAKNEKSSLPQKSVEMEKVTCII